MLSLQLPVSINIKVIWKKMKFKKKINLSLSFYIPKHRGSYLARYTTRGLNVINYERIF